MCKIHEDNTCNAFAIVIAPWPHQRHLLISGTNSSVEIPKSNSAGMSTVASRGIRCEGLDAIYELLTPMTNTCNVVRIEITF